MSPIDKPQGRQQLISQAEEALQTSRPDSARLLTLAVELEANRLSELALKIRQKELLGRAWDQLRSPGGDTGELYALALELKNRGLFEAARRVVQRARRADTGQQLKLVQLHALCTYKDPDMPAYKALADALRILEDHAQLSTTDNAETLGLAGAIFKRKWQNDGSKQNLETALAYYLRGYDNGTPGERAYTGINAAYVLDLLAYVEDQHARDTHVVRSSTTDARRVQARRIRENLIDILKPADEAATGAGDTKLGWWDCASLAEAHFGLGPYDEKDVPVEQSHYYKALGWTLKGMLTHSDSVPSWEFESTARQLATLAQLQVGDSLNEPAWEVIRQLVGPDRAEALVAAVFRGKLGIGLSGGGFRASLYHIGVLARLAELDLLRHVEVISSVSGGSILGAYYYLKLRKLLQTKDDSQLTREDYIQLVDDMSRDFLVNVQSNMRNRIASNLFDNLKMAFSNRYSRTDRLAELYEKHLYSLLGPEQKLTMNELGISARGAEPGEANWQRKNKVPNLVLNATSLNTGHNWQFTTSSMGESAFSVDEEIDGNWLLRRLDYRDAPPEHRNVSLGQAVGASACVPGLFEPVTLRNLYPKTPKRAKDDAGIPEVVLRLVDGGVHDNQGVVSLIEQDCSVIVVSDASGQMTSVGDPGGGLLGPILRTNSVLMERLRQAQFQDLKARLRAGILKGLMIVHMKKDFDIERIDWRGCDEPTEQHGQQASQLLPYGVRKELQAALAATRTDLDSFSDIEGQALMASGYLMTKKYAEQIRSIYGSSAEQPEPAQWAFMQMAEPLGYDNARARNDAEGSITTQRYLWTKKNLELAAKGSFRAFSLSPRLRFWVVGLGILIPAIVAWRILDERLALLLVLLVAAVSFFGKWVARILLGVVQLLFSVVGVLGAQLLLVFDRVFLRLGRLEKAPAKKK